MIKRIATADRIFFSILSVMRSRNIHKETKIRLYKAHPHLGVLWKRNMDNNNQNSRQTRNTFKRKMLRRIYGSMNKDGLWRMRYNQELYNLCKEPKLSVHIKLKKFRWAEHVQRMQKKGTKKGLNRTARRKTIRRKAKIEVERGCDPGR